MQTKEFVNIIKFITFILFMRGMFFFTEEIINISIFMTDWIIEKIFPNIFGIFNTVFLLIFHHYLRIIFEYFLAKKMGVVQFLDKFPFLVALLIVFLMDVLILFHPGFYNTYEKKWVEGAFMMDSYCWLGYGFIHVFFSYKIAGFLSRKFKCFKFLEKFYPRILEKIPNIYLLGSATIIAYPYLKYQIDNVSLEDQTYIPSLILFFVMIAIFFIAELIKTIKKKIK